MPYSPKVTLVPPLAAPWRSGRCCLRCFTLRGMSISSALLACGRWHGGLRGRVLAFLAGPQGGGRRLALGPGLRCLAPVDPDLHADPAEGGPRLVEAVVDVGAQRVQRDAPFTVELRPGH